ncbi:internal scaffolding protein [Microviridae sp.]|nr:internal scaffolding protein [Microviridae sp.]
MKRLKKVDNMQFKTAYAVDVEKIDYGYNFHLPSLALQSAKDECDITKILEKYRATGVPPSSNENPPIFQDVSELEDYSEVMRNLKDAEFYFDSLPATERENFDNDPLLFLDYLVAEQNKLDPEPDPELPNPDSPKESSTSLSGEPKTQIKKTETNVSTTS